jgi:hypothetical protein
MGSNVTDTINWCQSTKSSNVDHAAHHNHVIWILLAYLTYHRCNFGGCGTWFSHLMCVISSPPACWLTADLDFAGTRTCWDDKLGGIARFSHARFSPPNRVHCLCAFIASYALWVSWENRSPTLEQCIACTTCFEALQLCFIQKLASWCTKWNLKFAFSPKIGFFSNAFQRPCFVCGTWKPEGGQGAGRRRTRDTNVLQKGNPQDRGFQTSVRTLASSERPGYWFVQNGRR